MDKKTLAVACRGFFGLLPGQDLKGFSEEMRQLTPKDREELAEMFEKAGIAKIIPAQGTDHI